MFLSEDQNCGMYEKIMFCDPPGHYHTFHSAPIVNYTENGPLTASPVDGLDMFDKMVDIMRMLRSEDQDRPNLTSLNGASAWRRRSLRSNHSEQDVVYHSFEDGLIVQHKTVNWVGHLNAPLVYIRLVSSRDFGKRICTPPYTPLHTTPHTHSALASSCYSLAWHWCCRTSPSWGSRCSPFDPASLGSIAGTTAQIDQY